MSIFVLLFSALCAFFFVGVLRFFREINLYIASFSAGDRVFCGYVRSDALSQWCTVTAFGEGFISVFYTRDRVRSFIRYCTEQKESLQAYPYIW